MGADAIVAALGAAVLLVGLLALPWYGVGEGKIAPIEIQRPVPALHAQLEAPGQPELPGEVPLEALPEAPEQDEFGAWTAQGPLGTIGNVVLLLAALGGAGLAALRLAGPQAPRWAGPLVAALGVAAIAVVVLRLLLPPEEIEGYEFEATLEAGGFVALAGALLVAVGGVIAAVAGTAPREAEGSPR